MRRGSGVSSPQHVRRATNAVPWPAFWGLGHGGRRPGDCVGRLRRSANGPRQRSGRREKHRSLRSRRTTQIRLPRAVVGRQAGRALTTRHMRQIAARIALWCTPTKSPLRSCADAWRNTEGMSTSAQRRPGIEWCSSTLNLTPHTLHPTPGTPHTLHPAPCTLHPAPCTSRSTPYTLNAGQL